MNAVSFTAIQAALARGDAGGAKAAADALLAQSGIASAERIAALKLRSRACELIGDRPGAIADMAAAAALDPRDARAVHELGILSADAGDLEKAIAAFQRATEIDPSYSRAWNNLGNALRATGNSEQAVAAFSQAVAVDPAYALGWANLGAVHRERGEDVAAEASLTRALALDPQQRVALLALAGLRRQLGNLDAAIVLYEQALRVDPRDANALLQLGGSLAERDDIDKAVAAFDAAFARDPRMLRAALGQHLTLPMVPRDTAAVQHARDRYESGLRRLAEELPRHAAAMESERALDELRWSNFLLAYQGKDDRELQMRYARLIEAIVAARAPQWLLPRSRRTRSGGPIRVGFVSAFFRDGTVGRYFEHWITDLPRDRFQVVLYRLQPGTDALTERLGQRADVSRDCVRWRPAQLARQIIDDGLDAVVYPELGMDATTFALGALRLAPLQCAAWGHPVTTGHASIDVFFTSEAMEPADGDRHYVERVVRLPGIGTRYAMPITPGSSERARLGLPEGVPLLLCPQSLFKIHPDNDALFACVLAAVPDAHLLFFEGRHPALTATFRARLTAAFSGQGANHAMRIRILPQVDHDEYLRINLVCDAMLDTLHWSGGNTSLDALACGLPIVTLPGRYMRGRQSAGMLTLMGLEEFIAADAGDYVGIAARLATDASWREQVATRIRAAGQLVFDDRRGIEAFASTLEALA